MGHKIDSINMNVRNKNAAFSFGFTTAGGSSIKVSDKALSKAQQFFKDDSEVTDNNHQKPSKIQTRTNESRVKIPNVGLETNAQLVDARNGALLKRQALCPAETSDNTSNVVSASYNSLCISDEDLSKAVQQFEDHETYNGFQTVGDQRSEPMKRAAPSVGMLFHKETIDDMKDMSSIGFSTAGGSSINVSKTAVTKAMQLFANDLEDTNTFEETCLVDKQSNNYETPVKPVGFQTASGQCMNIPEEALSKAKALFNEESLEDFESSASSKKLLQKRKIVDLNDDAIANKQVTSNQFKKLRFSSEFEVKKNVTNDDKSENRVVEILPSNNNVDKFINDIYKTEANKEHKEMEDNRLISHEIVESAAALLADEKSSDSFERWISPVENVENKDTANESSSPVLGGQFIPRKRKSVGGQRKSLNALKNKMQKSIYMQNPEEDGNLLLEKQKSIAEEEQCDTSVVSNFGDTQLMIDFIDESANIVEKRLEAASKQETQINLKEKNKPKPTISVLYSRRKTNNNRTSWREISKGNAPVPCTYEELVERKLPPEILDITADNAESYKFQCKDIYEQDVVQNNIGGIRLEDGAYMILDENGCAGITEIMRAFLASPGVDPNLVPTGWVKNHYRWIVWKLASMDRIMLGSVILPRALTPDRVMMELKYRYDREIDRSERSALRKILEKDDVPSKRMILCVSSITECNDSAVNLNPLKSASKKLILTDGWYSVQAFIDQAMIQNITSGKVKEGMKLVTYGSELLDCDQGYSPLEVPENVSLKIHTNSTRRARWDARLGYTVPSGPMCVKLRSICPNGGLIGKIKVLIARVYPILYYEKTGVGESIFRNTRCEEKANIAYEKECRSMIESFYAKAEKYYSTGGRKSNENPEGIDLASIEWDEDFEKLSREEFVTKQEQERLMNERRLKEEKFRKTLESRLQESLPAPRQVTPVLKIRIIEEERSAILSVWSSNEETTDILKEGNYVSISNVMPLAKRCGEVQLTTNRSTLFNQINVSNIVYPRRAYTALSEVKEASFAPAYGEFDTVGIVVSVGSEPYGMKNFEAVHFAYPSMNSRSWYLNLEWRRATSWSIPIAYCTERTTFTRNPRQSHFQQPFEDLKRSIMDNGAYVAACAAEISEEVEKKSITRTSDHYTPNRNSNFDKISTNESSSNTLRELSGMSLTTNETIKSVAIKKRLERLQYYGEPSSLSPIMLNNSSKRVSLDFRSPVRSSNVNERKAQVSLNKQFSQNLR
ncbi:breast cancer type 2 susceptibility protein homolog isoform X2 [Colletes gigas]|uniref:breast cancer type 2 susceptibility protein homolog isoform X2 n=1 Tax=Colletes gigas TaxID=935657 RepID=UPI001C9B227A|nr:breast cancer type 2 susceptibility protein homolog isoform X2 [Colletes gigas]